MLDFFLIEVTKTDKGQPEPKQEICDKNVGGLWNQNKNNNLLV